MPRRRSETATRLSTLGLCLVLHAQLLLRPVKPFQTTPRPALAPRPPPVFGAPPAEGILLPRHHCSTQPPIYRRLTSVRRSADESHSGAYQDPAERRNETVTDRPLPLPPRRRELFLRSAVAILLGSASTTMLLPTVPSYARGWVQFPCTQPLLNTYHFMRTGTSLLEAQDIWSTNPLFLTNRDDALAPEGEVQVVQACDLLRASQHSPTVVRYSLAASCMDAATLVSRELKLGRDRVVAEYTYLDPRAIGQWDMGRLSRIEPAVWALDDREAGVDGTGGRPPPNIDGTPHETLADQAVRLRQLLSVLETLYSGDTVLLIFPDGTGPALLSALMAGIPLSQSHRLEYTPGEVRLNVTRDSVLALYDTRESTPSYRDSYEQVVRQGRDTLQQLRTADPDLWVSRRDQQIEDERIALETEFQAKKQRQIEARNAAEQAQRIERQKQLAEAAGDGATRGAPSTTVLLGVAGTVALSGIAVAVAPSDTTERNLKGTPAAPIAAVSESGVATASLPGSSTVAVSSGPGVGLYGTPPRPPPVNGEDATGTALERPPPTTAAANIAAPSPPLTIPERREAARVAMEAYLDRDDGAGDWLQSLADILQDEDDGDDATEKDETL